MDKKERILNAALELFVEFGFHHTPTSKIAKKAGVATGTLFYFFATKDDLVKALYLDIKNRLGEYVSDIIKNEKSLSGILRGHYSATLYWALANEQEYRFVEQFNTSPYFKQIASEEIEKHINPIMDLLRKGITDKIIKPLDVEVIYSLISGQTFAINQYMVSRQLPEPFQDAIINETFELLWGMIAENPTVS